MDPNECWKEIVDSIATRYYGVAENHIGDLLYWYENGGFQVEGVSREFLEGLYALVEFGYLVTNFNTSS